jgi:hypothetical protein
MVKKSMIIYGLARSLHAAKHRKGLLSIPRLRARGSFLQVYSRRYFSNAKTLQQNQVPVWFCRLSAPYLLFGVFLRLQDFPK